MIRRNAVPALVALTALTSTIAVWRYVAGVVEAQQRDRFTELAQGHLDDLRGRMEAYTAMLRAGRGFLAALGREPTSDEFHAFVTRLELARRFPGIQGFGWSRLLTPAELPAHVAEQRAAGRPDYRVWPEGPRPVYSAIVLLEPLDWRNQRAIGYDMFSQETRREAMQRAADTGEAAASGRVELVQEAGSERQSGFLVYVPVYRGEPRDAAARHAALRGWVYAPFRAADLVRSLGGAEEIGIEVYDGDAPRREALLYEHDFPGAPVRALAEPFEVAGRRWTVRYAAGPGFATAWERALPKAVLGMGLLLSALLFWLTRDEARARRRAELAASRAAFLAEAGTILAGSLDYLRTLPEVARLAAERVTNACIVQVAEHGQPFWTVGHRDVVVARRIEAALRASGLASDPEAALTAVIRDRRPHVALVRPESGALARSPEVAAAFRDAGLRELLTVPMFARGEPLGTVAFFSARRRRRFGPQDVALVEDLARLVVAAIDTSRLYARAQEALRERDDFLSIASHELKTPLTSLLLQSEALRSSARRGDTDGLVRKAEVIRRNVDRLSRLVSSLLDLSRIAAGRLEIEIEEVDLVALTREVVARFEEEADRAGCKLVLSAPDPIFGRWDTLRLDQVITNLLSNAIKYGPGQPVEIELRRAGDAAVLTVRDKGIGISEADQGRIFERFERAVSKRNYGGFGLGLWISRQIVEALGGEVRVESSPGEGSTFTVELWGARSARERAERPGAPTAPPSPP